MCTLSRLRVIIAGGATGLGAVTAKLLAHHGAKVVVGRPRHGPPMGRPPGLRL